MAGQKNAKINSMTSSEFPLIPVPSAAAWQTWIHEHNDDQSGVWLRLAKKGKAVPTVAYDDILDIALCYGWIDGQRKGLDDTYFLQKFTPRRPRSLWSRRNVDNVARLTAAGKMQPRGLAEVEAAKKDGRWEAAYDSQKNFQIPDDFLTAVENNEKAKTFFDTLNKTNKYAIAFRLTTAKRPETRRRRFDALLTMLEKGEKFY